MTKIKIIAIGELLWDYLPKGEKMGGAAANFTYHAQSTNADAVLVSAIGNDADGKALLNELIKFNIHHQIQTSLTYATGKVLVELDAAGKPTYDIVDPVAWDDIQLTDSLITLISNDINAIYFGTLIQRHVNNHLLLTQIIAKLSPATKVIVDINLRQNHFNHDTLLFSINCATILKINDEELPVIAALLDIECDPHALFNYLQQHNKIELLIYTCGSQGSLLITNTECNYCASLDITPIDTVGAGDSFAAVASVLYLRGETLATINKVATTIAGYVCTQNGPMPKIPAGLFS